MSQIERVWPHTGYDLHGTNYASDLSPIQTDSLTNYCFYDFSPYAVISYGYGKSTIGINHYISEGEDEIYIPIYNLTNYRILAIKVHPNETVEANKKTVRTINNNATSNGYFSLGYGGSGKSTLWCTSQTNNKIYEMDPETESITDRSSGLTTIAVSSTGVSFANQPKSANEYLSPPSSFFIAASSTYDSLYKFSNDGTELWKTTLRNSVSIVNFSTPIISLNGSSGDVYIIAITTGPSTNTVLFRLGNFSGLNKGLAAIVNPGVPSTIHLAANQTKGFGATGIIYVGYRSGSTVYLQAYDYTLNLISTLSFTSGSVDWPPFAIDTNGIIHFAANNILYAIEDDGTGTLSVKHSVIIPSTITGGITIDSVGNIIVCNNQTTPNINVRIYNYDSVYGYILNAYTSLPFNSYVTQTPIIGKNGFLYLVTNNNIFYAYGTGISPTTTTTTSSTTTITPTTTTTTTGTGTTTTTTTPTTTTTTTTTTPPPLAIVNTIQFDDINGQLTAIQSSNASDSSTTQNSLLAQSFSFGTIAPGQTSKTVIVSLNIPYVKAIANIKMGLISAGGITFSNSIFGITSSVELRDDIVPDNYFQGINTDKTSTNANNISIPNKDNHTSAYVYLNVQVPNDQVIETGIVKMKWFFDYAE